MITQLSWDALAGGAPRQQLNPTLTAAEKCSQQGVALATVRLLCAHACLARVGSRAKTLASKLWHY